MSPLRGDPWAALAPGRAEAMSAAALRRVLATTRPSRPSRQRWVVAFVVLGASFALAALGDATRAREVPAPVPAVPAVPAPAPKPRVPSVEPSAPPLVPVSEAPRRPLGPPVKRAQLGVKRADDALAAESKLLLEALRALRVEKNPKAALAKLDAYALEFPKGTLKDEADALRREATRGDAP
ncbi:MAG: hypothetical protein JNK82_32955 [Myxococcaceae bacterium]|nr:hypothetical protein [Myxococcaceae bacterium]